MLANGISAGNNIQLLVFETDQCMYSVQSFLNCVDSMNLLVMQNGNGVLRFNQILEAGLTYSPAV